VRPLVVGVLVGALSWAGFARAGEPPPGEAPQEPPSPPASPEPSPLPPLSQVDLSEPPGSSRTMVVAAPDEAPEEAPDAALTEPPPPSPGIGDCMLFPEPHCAHSMVFELGMGGGETVNYAGTFPYFRAFAEVGYLTQVTRDLHVGPVLTAAIATHAIYFDGQLSPRARLRWFVGGTHFVVEHAAGLDYQGFSYHDADESGSRLGVTGDLGFGYRGIVGPFGLLSVLADPSGQADLDLRWGAGLRFNLVALGAALAGLSEPRMIF
jgi:hypothetical protein